MICNLLLFHRLDDDFNSSQLDVSSDGGFKCTKAKGVYRKQWRVKWLVQLGRQNNCVTLLYIHQELIILTRLFDLIISTLRTKVKHE